MTSNLRGNIEAIKSLFKYYKLLQVALEHFEDFETFEKNSNIKVQIDYRSASNTIRQFTDLRQSLKFIWFDYTVAVTLDL